jgi:hypothetical protein
VLCDAVLWLCCAVVCPLLSRVVSPEGTYTRQAMHGTLRNHVPIHVVCGMLCHAVPPPPTPMSRVVSHEGTYTLQAETKYA